MKKIINLPQDVVNETLEGFVEAYGHLYERVEGAKGLRVRDIKDKVSFVIGGGSGHEPLFGMFLGENLADATVSGNIFASPDPNTIIKVVNSVQQGKGVLFVYGNYAGDNMNFDMAEELLQDMGIETRSVRVRDDVASAPKDRISDRRGIAGDVFVIKIGGAVTGAGLDLEESYNITSRSRDNTYSIGVGLSGGTIPGEEKPAFTLPDDEIEFGLGVHGEPGIKRMKIVSADEIVDILLEKILKDSEIKKGDEVCTLINGLGSTTLAEMYIMNRRLAKRLKDMEIVIYDMEVNSYITCQEMAGASITLFKLDDELKKYYDMPCWSPYYSKR